jgi:hypothetical protein
MTEIPNTSYLSQFPITAVVACHELSRRLAPYSPLAITRKILSQSLTIGLLAVGMLGIYHVTAIVQTLNHAPAKPATAATAIPRATPSAGLPRSAPISLNIPSISLSASSIVDVGQTSDGALDVPGPADVGWYTLGPAPGEIGPAVIVGHVDSALTGPAVFWNLRQVQIGDLIAVGREDGRSVTFTVEKVASYDQNSFPTDEVYGNLTYAGLRLITCDGDFNYATHHYSKNLVIYARAQPQP